MKDEQEFTEEELEHILIAKIRCTEMVMAKVEADTNCDPYPPDDVHPLSYVDCVRLRFLIQQLIGQLIEAEEVLEDLEKKKDH